jgi:hypothetical protein
MRLPRSIRGTASRPTSSCSHRERYGWSATTSINDQAPLGLGSFNLRATGDLFIFKAPGQTVTVTGSFDSITGTSPFRAGG